MNIDLRSPHRCGVARGSGAIRRAAAILLLTALNGCAMATLPSTAAGPASPAGSTTQSAVKPGLFEMIAQLFQPGPLGSSTESVCEDAEQAVDVGTFTGMEPFTTSSVTGQIKATVRLSLKSPEEVDRIMKTDFKIQSYDMGSFKKLWTQAPSGFGGGFCTGTLLLSNIVLSAGHCVDANDLRAKHATPPAVYDANGDFVRDMTPREISALLKVDFNFQHVYVSSDNPFLITSPSNAFSIPVDAWIDSAFGPSPSGKPRDYLLLRLQRSDRNLAEYALGLRNIDYDPPTEREALAVVQHSQGDVKKIAVGNLKSVRGRNLFYSNLNTDNGSSGAGIIDKNGKLVGIHTNGGCDNPTYGYANRGLRMISAKDAIDDIAPRKK